MAFLFSALISAMRNCVSWTPTFFQCLIAGEVAPSLSDRGLRVNSRSLKASSKAAKNVSTAAPPVTDDRTGGAQHTVRIRAEPGPFQDIPRVIWIIFLSAWAFLFTLFILFFAVTPEAAFVVTVAAVFALMAFGLPAAMAAQGKCDGHECKGIVQTRTGPLSVAAAGTQIVLIPVAAVIGLIAFIAFVIS